MINNNSYNGILNHSKSSKYSYKTKHQPMQTLLNELEAQGLSDDQIQNLFLTIHEWLDAHYPVMAKISKQAMARELGIRELSMPSYVIIDQY
jgi:hypothetical protein